MLTCTAAVDFEQQIENKEKKNPLTGISVNISEQEDVEFACQL